MSKEAWTHRLQYFEMVFLKVVRFQRKSRLWKSGLYSAMELTGFLFLEGIVMVFKYLWGYFCTQKLDQSQWKYDAIAINEAITFVKETGKKSREKQVVEV